MALFVILIILLPFAEIYALIVVGNLIGFLPTMAILIGLSLAGAFLLRQQGTALLFKTTTAMARGEMPLGAVLDGAGLTLAAGLLMTPGFITDVFGFLLLLPPVRKVVMQWVAGRFLKWHVFGPTRDPEPHRADPPRQPSGSKTIDGEFRRLDD